MSGALLQPFKDLHRARFVERPNRFVIRAELGSGELVDAYLPNPGRLRELLLPDAAVLLTRRAATSTGKTDFTAVGVLRRGRPIMLHTHLTNAAARALIEAGEIEELEGARVVSAEHTVGRSRFDFLLERRGAPLLLEVKSCTLVSERVAMFPDAVTARGARHVRELAELSRQGRATAVLFVVHWPEARIFAPDYHTDLEFARALLESRGQVQVTAVAVEWSAALELLGSRRSCLIPWPLIEGEAQDRGSYLVVLELEAEARIATGALGELRYRPGFYVYAGSAMTNLTKRLARHRRRRKRHHWHLDHLRARAEVVDTLAVRASDRLECQLAAAVRAQADWTVARFGATDCGCGGHLFGFTDDPRRRPGFQRMLLRLRMDRLERLIDALGSRDD